MFMRRVPLVHVDIVHPVFGAELGVDSRLRGRVVEVGTEREQFPTGDLEVLQLSAHNVLQVVVLTWTGRWERDPVRPVEERGAGIVEGVRGRPRLLVQVGEPGGQEWQPSKDRVAQQRLGPVKDYQRFGDIPGAHIHRYTPRLSVPIQHPDLEVRRLRRARGWVFPFPSIELRAEHSVYNGHTTPPWIRPLVWLVIARDTNFRNQ